MKERVYDVNKRKKTPDGVKICFFSPAHVGIPNVKIPWPGSQQPLAKPLNQTPSRSPVPDSPCLFCRSRPTRTRLRSGSFPLLLPFAVLPSRGPSLVSFQKLSHGRPLLPSCSLYPSLSPFLGLVSTLTVCNTMQCDRPKINHGTPLKKGREPAPTAPQPFPPCRLWFGLCVALSLDPGRVSTCLLLLHIEYVPCI